MLVALVPVIGIDVFLEARSRAALKQLARSTAPRARAMRDGRQTNVDTADLVPATCSRWPRGSSSTPTVSFEARPTAPSTSPP